MNDRLSKPKKQYHLWLYQKIKGFVNIFFTGSMLITIKETGIAVVKFLLTYLISKILKHKNMTRTLAIRHLVYN